MTPPGYGTVVLVVDDHPVVRFALVTLLGGEPWAARVVEAATVREADAAAVAHRPGVAVVDLGLPDGNGLDLLHRLHRAVPGCRTLVLTMTRDDATVRACLAAGASGYVLKDTGPAAILNALRTVADGGLVLGPRVERVTGPELAPPLDRLSPRDLRLLGMVAQGSTNPQIARALGLTEKTVRNRLSGILTTIGAADRVQAALLARDRGLLGR